MQHNIQLVPEWIPREEYIFADEKLKSIDVDDYMLSPDIFTALDMLWGPHIIDRLSSLKTRPIPHFSSHWRTSGAEVIDAVSWSSQTNWVFLPPYLVSKVLKHMLRYGADGTLIAPQWVSAPWWPLLFQAKGSSGKKYMCS